MKKVEIYFLINLGAILSIFAIEGELGEYMRRQDDILPVSYTHLTLPTKA